MSGLLLVLAHFVYLGGSGDFIDQRMFRGERHVGHAPERIRTGSEDLDGVTGFGFKDDRGPAGLANPITLQRFNELWPIETVVIQQFFSIVGRAEKPLLQIFADHGGATTLAVAIVSMDLLSRQGCVAAGAKVDRGELLVSQVVFIELVEKPLRPVVVLGVSGNDLRTPVETVAHRF